jgi:prepilin signal peptidase PulO-like enzyme (type II secretory pathway)
MEKFKIQEKNLKRKGDLIKRNDNTGLPFAIFLIVSFLIAYLLFQYIYFAK